ncbi:hypothetical protein GCM10022247_22320 [Allokutzneria multivorans]|uniref:Secreted protein n=1 Tax=Allokutzneria multivorans TaxID=1142134 RepID=A0ABP7RRU5_9PSEU
MLFKNVFRRAAVSAVAVTAAMSTLVVPAQAGMSGCNDITCITINGSGLSVHSIRASLTWRSKIYGHFHIWGGGIDMNTHTATWTHPEGYTLRVGRDLPNRSVVCVQGWEHQSGGGTRSIGRACGEIKF